MSNESSWQAASASEQLRQAWESLRTVFPPNPHKYGVLLGYTEGRKDVSTKMLGEDGEGAEEAWKAVFSRHLQAKDEGRIGYLAGSMSGTTVGCIDIDHHVHRDQTDSAMRKVLDAAMAVQIAPLLERSTSGGWHVWLFARREVPYEVMRDALRHLVSGANVGMLEVYPMGSSGPRGRWVFMPYAGVSKRKDGLGRTYLETVLNEPIPIWDLTDQVATRLVPPKTLEKLAAAFVREQERYLESSSAPGELSDAALEQLRTAARNPPDGFDRHHSVFAFVNVAEKAGQGRGREMAAYLQTEEIYDLWVRRRGGGRSFVMWVDELERIWETVREASEMDARRFGIPFLVSQGWEVPELERRMGALTVMKGWNRSPDDDVAARWLAQKLQEVGSPVAYDQNTPFVYDRGTWRPMNGVGEVTRVALEKVLRPEGARVVAQRTTGRIRWMLEGVVARPLVGQTDPERIAVVNGLLNLKKGRMEPHDPTVVTLGRAPVEWSMMHIRRENALLQPLRDFLREAMFARTEGVDPQLIEDAVEDYFRAWAWVIDPERRGRYFLDFHGPTSTGKSTAVKAALMVLGDVVAGDELGMITGLDVDALEVQEFTAALIGRTGFHFDDLALSGDRRVDRRIVNFLKKISAGAVVNVNRKFMANERVLIKARAVVSTNGVLSTGTEDTEALNMRSWRLGFFGRRVPREEQVPDFERILLPTEEHRVAFLRCVVRHWRELDAAGGRRLPLSAQVQTAIFGEAERLQHPVVLWLQDQCEPGTAEEWVGNSQLLKAYNMWAAEHGEKKHNAQTFGEAMRHAHTTLTSPANLAADEGGERWNLLEPTRRRSQGEVIRGWQGVKLTYSGYDVVS